MPIVGTRANGSAGALGFGAKKGKLPYLWVSVGQSGNLSTSTSTTASSWTTRTSSFSTTDILGVASNGTSLYVAVGSTGKLATSPDGISWTQRTSSFGTSEVNGVAFGNGYWVAVGASAKVAHSTDGITWTQVTTGITGTVCAVGYGNGLWVILSLTGAMYTATNPTSTWTSRTSTLSAGSFGGVFYWPSQAIWIAGMENGTTGALASSTDGATWTARNSDVTSAYGLNSGFTANTTVAVIGTTTNILTPTCQPQSSTNGTTWTNRTPATSTATMFCAASDDAGLIACVGSKVQTTTNGSTYTDRGTTTNTSNYFICHSSGTPSIR